MLQKWRVDMEGSQNKQNWGSWCGGKLRLHSWTLGVSLGLVFQPQEPNGTSCVDLDWRFWIFPWRSHILLSFLCHSPGNPRSFPKPHSSSWDLCFIKNTLVDSPSPRCRPPGFLLCFSAKRLTMCHVSFTVRFKIPRIQRGESLISLPDKSLQASVVCAELACLFFCLFVCEKQTIANTNRPQDFAFTAFRRIFAVKLKFLWSFFTQTSA